MSKRVGFLKGSLHRLKMFTQSRSTFLTRGLQCHMFILLEIKQWGPKNGNKLTWWYFLIGKKFKQSPWSKTACLEKDLVLGVDPESTSKEQPPPKEKPKKNRLETKEWLEKDEATVPFESVFDRAMKLPDCTLVGFRQKAFQTGEHTFKIIVNGARHATSTCGKAGVRTEMFWWTQSARACLPSRPLWPLLTQLQPCTSRCIRPLPDNPRLKSWFCCWLKRRCQWWRRDRNELHGQKNDTSGVKCEWWVIFCLGINK